MNRNMQTPEAMLSRAKELIDLGKPKMALETMVKVFCQKSWAYNWSESNLEPFMLQYLNLCVELKNSQVAKEGLYQYRNVFLTSNPGTVENVVHHFLKTAEAKVESMKMEATSQAVAEVDDDFDNLAINMSVVENAMSGKDNHEMLNQGILTPWVKFIWDCYCNCLELLRNNNVVALLYQDVTKMTFAFCKSYNRKTEFRKLGDKLRKHVDMKSENANKKLHLELRFVQLDYSLDMKLWYEAYKVIEDIKKFMNSFAKIPHKIMENYYEKLALVFWNSENYLFHAAALFKLFQLHQGIGSTAEDKIKMIASRVVIAILSIPLSSISTVNFDNFFEDDLKSTGKDKKSLDLLSFSRLPTRKSLLSDIVESNALSFVAPEIQQMYNCLEVTIDPLSVCTRMETLMNLIQENSLMFQYVPSIRTVTLSLFLSQIAQAYETITLERLVQLSKFSRLAELEHLLIRRTDLQVRIDHRNKCVYFGRKIEMFGQETFSDGPMLQTNFNSNLSDNLEVISAALHRGVAVIKNNEIKKTNDDVRKKLVEIYHATKVEQRERMLERQEVIEKQLGSLDVEKNEEVEKLKQEEINEKKRVEEEKVRRKKEEEELARKQAAAVELELNRKKNEELQAKAKIELLQKEKRGLEAKRKAGFKKIDYLIRAKRLEEIPLIKEFLRKREILDEAVWNQEEKERVGALIKERKHRLADQKRLQLLKEDKNVFIEMCSARVDHEYEEKMKDFNVVLSGERKKCLEERRKARVEERRAKWMEEKQKEIESKEKEELRIRKEEEERKIREKKQMLELAAAKQKKKEEEIEKRLDQERGVHVRNKRCNGNSSWRTQTDGGEKWKKDGSVQQKNSGNYVPPRLRGAQQGGSSAYNDRRDDRTNNGGKTSTHGGSDKKNANNNNKNNWRKRNN